MSFLQNLFGTEQHSKAQQSQQNGGKRGTKRQHQQQNGGAKKGTKRQHQQQNGGGKKKNKKTLKKRKN